MVTSSFEPVRCPRCSTVLLEVAFRGAARIKCHGRMPGGGRCKARVWVGSDREKKVRVILVDSAKPRVQDEEAFSTSPVS